MSEYRRVVSYLYKYVKGKKEENTGYVRVENRQDGLRIQFHIKDLRMTHKSPMKVYFYIHKKENIQTFFVDEFLFSQENCEYKNTILPQTDLPDLSEIHGVIFMKENALIYGSCWDDREIIEEQILLHDAVQEIEEAQTLPDNDIEKMGKISENTSPKNISLPSEIETDTDTAIETVVDTVATEAVVDRVSEIILESSEVKAPEITLLEEREKIDFGDSSSSIEAVKISLSDLDTLKNESNSNSYSQNPFLLQGYETYGYLLFGKVQFPEKEPFWILGIPGTYHNREKYLADLYGFSDYIPEKICQFQTGGRGYWIAML